MSAAPHAVGDRVLITRLRGGRGGVGNDDLPKPECEDYAGDDARLYQSIDGDWLHACNDSDRCPGQGDDDTDDTARAPRWATRQAGPRAMSDHWNDQPPADEPGWLLMLTLITLIIAIPIVAALLG